MQTGDFYLLKFLDIALCTQPFFMTGYYFCPVTTPHFAQIYSESGGVPRVCIVCINRLHHCDRKNKKSRTQVLFRGEIKIGYVTFHWKNDTIGQLRRAAPGR